jgi:hypothetical protein
VELPWVYSFVEEPRPPSSQFLQKPLLRPTVRIQLVQGPERSQIYVALVDSGCDHVLAPHWVANEIGVEPDPARTIPIRIGGATRDVAFADVTLRLCPPEELGSSVSPFEWQTTVGFYSNWADPPWVVVLGQVGFYDQFTVLMSRHSQRLAIYPTDHFDECHPWGPETSPGGTSGRRFP